jgi:hypothetical protein
MDNAKQVFSEELQKLTVDGLKNMGDWVQGAKDFAVEQAPLFAQEYVKWYAVDNIKTAIILAVMVAIFIWSYKKAYSWLSKIDDGDDFIKFVAFVMAVICFIICTTLTGFAIDNLGDAVKAYVSPRVVIVEGIKEILDTSRN